MFALGGFKQFFQYFNYTRKKTKKKKLFIENTFDARNRKFDYLAENFNWVGF